MIITVPDLFLINGELKTSDGKGGFMNIHDQQGTLDGACAVYSVVMCMLYENIICDNERETQSRTSGGKLLKELFTNHGLVKGGFYFDKLVSLINEYAPKTWRVEYFGDKTPAQCVKGICEEIKYGCAPIIGVGYAGENFGHALLAVAYEEIEGKIEKIFCLDPGAPTPITSIWNSYIDVHNLRRSSSYVNTLTTPLIPELVKIQDYIVIENLKSIPISLR